MDNARGLLRDRGYQAFPPGLNTHACAAYQLVIRVTDEHGATVGKRFVNVWEYDQSQFMPNIKSMYYEVEQTFETTIGRQGDESTWFQGKFYSLTARQLRALLPELEKMHEKLFEAMDGVLQ